MEDLRDTPPNPVKIRRLKKSPSDTADIEEYEGFLVDEYGDNVEAPEIGYGLYLAAQDSKEPWIFASDEAYLVEVYGTHWVVVTELGNRYEIVHERILQ